MAAKFDDLIQEVIHNLSAFSQINDAMASLDVAISASDNQLSVQDIGGFSQGVIQVDDELMFVQRVDAATHTLVVPPWGRGFRGSEKAAHDAGSLVTMSPTWPRATVLRGITQCLRGVYPGLFAVKYAELTASGSAWTHALPEATERVLDVRWRVPGGTREWERVRSYDVLWGQDEVDFPGGVALEIYDGIPSGAKIRVSYAAVPGTSESSNAYFSSVTGLPESCRDLVVMGATYRMLPYLDASRLPVAAVAGTQTDKTNAVGTASQAAQTFLSLYTSRLQQEIRAIDAKYPPRYRKMR